MSSASCSSRSRQNSPISLLNSPNSSNKDNSLNKELAHRELASKRDGGISSSSCLEIVVPEIVDEDIPGLSPLPIPDNSTVEEGSAFQLATNNLFGVILMKLDAESIAKMVSSCSMPSELEFRIPTTEK